MKLTFTVLLLCWTIYSSSHIVLSLPPSVIANAASLQQQQHQQKLQHKDQHHVKEKWERPPSSTADLNALWHKDVGASASAERAANKEGGSTTPDIISKLNSLRPRSSNTNNNEEHIRTSRMAEISTAYFNPQFEQQYNVPDIAANADAAYDLKGFLQATSTVDETSDNTDDDTSKSMEVLPLQQTLARIYQSQADSNEFFTPLKYWARHCQPGRNCPKQYNRALFTNRNSNKEDAASPNPGNSNKLSIASGVKNIRGVNREAALNVLGSEFVAGGNPGSDIFNKYPTKEKSNDDIFMFLRGEQDLIKFLNWAMQLLYPRERFANYTANSADYYHPGMFVWKKLNLSGNLEPPLFVEEPHYIIVRREQLSDDIKTNPKYKNDDPFIPPRGRKHNMPDLDALLHRYETFVPNRGKRDKIKDMLKSDDLFFPNRGKKLKSPMPATMKRDLEYENGSNKNTDRNTKATTQATSPSNDVDIVESKSSYNDDANDGDADASDDDDDDDNDWNRALPLAMLVRDVLEKLFQRKLQNQKTHRQPEATGNKITTNAHEINYFDDNNNNPEWMETMLNYKFNSYDPSVKQSMPAASAINGETREMSTPQKMPVTATGAAREVAQNLALQQLLRQHSVDDEMGNGVDRGGTKIPGSRLLSTRSMSTAMAQRRQQQQQQLQQRLRQKERLRQLQENRRLTALSQTLGADNNGNGYPQWHSIVKDQKQHHHQIHHQHHQVQPFTNFDPRVWQQPLDQQQEEEQRQERNIQYLQQKLKRQSLEGLWPRETLISQHDAFNGPYAQSYTRAIATVENDNDYNYSDI